MTVEGPNSTLDNWLTVDFLVLFGCKKSEGRRRAGLITWHDHHVESFDYYMNSKPRHYNLFVARSKSIVEQD